MKNKIVIIGNGKIGQAIFYLLRSSPSNKKYQIEVYDRNQARNKNKKSLKACTAGASFVFFCIPSWAEEKVLEEIAPIVKTETILISLSKGINRATHQSTDQLIEKDIKKAKYALLYGPMFASEIREGKHSFAILATKEKSIYQKIANLFLKTKLHLEYEKKVSSVAMSAILKNVYALIFGMLDASGEKNNTKGFLIARAQEEMMSLMKMLHLDEKMILGTAGLADFVATSFCEHSQNRKLGIAIFKTGKIPFKSEGLVSLPFVLKKLGLKSRKLPLLSLLKRIIINKKDARKEIEQFLKSL